MLGYLDAILRESGTSHLIDNYHRKKRKEFANRESTDVENKESADEENKELADEENK